MKYIMKDGMFVCKDNEQPITTNSISGKLVAIRTLEPESAPKKLQMDFKGEDDAGNEVVSTLSLRLYADPAIKILQCLYGIADIIADKVITINLEPREGHSALIVVLADNEVLPTCGFVHAYSESKVLFTDMAVETLKRVFNFRKDFLVYANADGVYPTSVDGGLDVDAVRNYILELRRLGRSGELTVKKTSFTSPAAAKGYIKALADIGGCRGFRWTGNAEEIEAIWDAFTSELPEVAPASEEEPVVVRPGMEG